MCVYMMLVALSMCLRVRAGIVWGILCSNDRNTFSSSVGMSIEWLTGVSQVVGSRPDVFSCELKIYIHIYMHIKYTWLWTDKSQMSYLWVSEGNVKVMSKLRCIRMPNRFFNNSARHTHAIQYCNIHYCRHGTVIQWLRAIGPHVLTLSQVDVSWAQRSLRFVLGENLVGLHEIKLTVTLFKHIYSRKPASWCH